MIAKFRVKYRTSRRRKGKAEEAAYPGVRGDPTVGRLVLGGLVSILEPHAITVQYNTLLLNKTIVIILWKTLNRSRNPSALKFGWPASFENRRDNPGAPNATTVDAPITDT